MTKTDIGKGVMIDSETLIFLNAYASTYYAYHDSVARNMITDPIQSTYFEDWLENKVKSPAASEMKEVNNAIIYLAMQGCG